MLARQMYVHMPTSCVFHVYPDKGHDDAERDSIHADKEYAPASKQCVNAHVAKEKGKREKGICTC